MPSQDIKLLLYLVISSRGDLVSALFKHFYKFLIKMDDVTNLNLIRRIRELNSPKEKLTLWNSYSRADVMFLFNAGYSLIIRRRFFNFNINSVFFS